MYIILSQVDFIIKSLLNQELRRHLSAESCDLLPPLVEDGGFLAYFTLKVVIDLSVLKFVSL